MSDHELAHVNVNEVHAESLSIWQKIIDHIALFAGSTIFLLVNILVFMVWLATGGVGHDSYPFQFLTMAVSLEAIILATLLLISQNRQAAKDRLAAEADYHTNLESKEEIEVILTRMEAILNHLAAQDRAIMEVEGNIMKRLDRQAPSKGRST
jgi:uncharacterized membrane protein